MITPLKNKDSLTRKYHTIGCQRVDFQLLSSREKNLNDKLESLRSYDTWAKAKANRLNIDRILSTVKKVQKEPMLQIARTYGFRNNTNEVLKQYVEQHIIRQNSPPKEPEQNNFQKILNKRLSHQRPAPPAHISFVNFKKNSTERDKIILMTSPQKRVKKTKNRSLKSSSLPNEEEGGKAPIQLKQLKRRLVSLPSVHRKERVSLPNLAAIESKENPQFSETTPEELWQLKKIIIEEKGADDKLYQEEVIESLKAGVIDRFEMRLASLRDAHKRNAKTYMKCIQGYKNDIKRQIVRANGLKRNKRLTMMEKIKQFTKEQEEAKEQQYLQNIT